MSEETPVPEVAAELPPADAGAGSEFGAAPAAPSPITLNGVTYPPLADGDYDAIVLGTGLKECVLSGLLAVRGMRVLVLDSNDYYGGECASLNLTNLYKKFVKDEEPPASFYTGLGDNRFYNVDLVPKFIMACGKLVKILVHTKATRYLNFKQVDGSFVYKSDGTVGKVPATEMEALSTSLVGFFQKRKLRNCLVYIAKHRFEDSKTWEGMDLRTVSARAFFDHFGLDASSVDFIGHAMALHASEEYLARPAIETVDAIKLYAQSLERYGKSPFLYPEYGLGGLPEAFSRLCAIHNGTFMLNAQGPKVEYGEDGVAIGVTATFDGALRAARARIVIGDPSYFPPEKVRRVGQVIRSICILNHPIPAVGGLPSAQIILPQNQTGRRSDIYVSIVSDVHEVAPKGKYVAIVSTNVETSNPRAEVAAGIALLGDVLLRFDNVVNTYAPVSDGRADHCFISESYDASSHFESTSTDILAMYERVVGEPLNMDISTTLEED